MKPLNLVFFSVFSGLLILATLILSASVITKRQAIITLGYYDFPNPPSLGDFIFVGRDGTVEHFPFSSVCPKAGGVIQEVASHREDIGAFQVSWAYSDKLNYLPWRTSIDIPVISVSTSPFTELFNAMVKRDSSCEDIIAERSRQNCLLVVSSIAVMDDGNHLASLSGCQLVGTEVPSTEDSIESMSSSGSGLRYKDIYGGVSAVERFWLRLRNPFMRTSRLG